MRSSSRSSSIEPQTKRRNLASSPAGGVRFSALRRYTSTSGIGFQAPVDGSWKTIVTFTPSESRPGELRYRLYKNRYAELAEVTLEEAETRMPAAEKRQPYLAEDPQYAGYDGMITSAAEIDRLAKPLQATGTPEPTAATSCAVPDAGDPRGGGGCIRGQTLVRHPIEIR
jgi:hypothetical protein